jgi:hypothetical protein
MENEKIETFFSVAMRFFSFVLPPFLDPTLFSSYLVSLLFLPDRFRQGDQIGRIFAHWVIYFFGQFGHKLPK